MSMGQSPTFDGSNYSDSDMDDIDDQQIALIMKQKLVSKARLPLLFVQWNKYQTANQKAALIHDFIKNHQRNQKRR